MGSISDTAASDFGSNRTTGLVQASVSGGTMCSIAKGTWVEVERVLPVASHARGVFPPLVRPAPQMERVAGFLLEAAELGQAACIRTITGRVLTGRLRIQSPGYGASFVHSFGPAGSERQKLRRRQVS